MASHTARAALALALSSLACAAHAADSSAPEPAVEVARHQHAFELAGDSLAGDGADFLVRATADSQFVLLGESHYRRDVPRFAGALFARLRERHGFRHLAVEQDAVAIEDALKDGRRGDARGIGRQAARYPGLFEFSSDQDLDLLARVGRLEAGSTAICGLEQTTGALRYLDELLPLAPDASGKAEIKRLRTLAAKLDHEPVYSVNFLIDAATPAAIESLRQRFAAQPGSRADELLLGLARSAEIFGYYRRAAAGEPVGLYNNTVREAWIKRQFVRCYREAAKTEALPKFVFKFGDNHMVRGKNPTQAYPIGNFAHEFAIWNGARAYGIQILSVGKDVAWSELPEWMRLLLPAQAPATPIVVDVEALRPLQRRWRERLPLEQRAAFNDFINGYDAIVVLPGDGPASMAYSGLKSPF